MSDGPYKSLPMPRHWKKLAKCLENSAYSLSEKDDVARFALSKGTKEIPLLEVLKIFNSGLLFKEVISNEIEDVRKKCVGSSIGNTFLDYAQDACLSGLTGKEATTMALKNTLRSDFEGRCRSMEEHYLRKDPKNKYNIQEKLKDIKSRCNYSTLANDVVEGKSISKTINKRTKIDEGPKL